MSMFNHLNPKELDYPIKITSKLSILYVIQSLAYTPKIIFDLEIDLLTLRVTSNDQYNGKNGFFSQNHTQKEVLHMILVLLVKNHIFLNLTLKLTF